MAAPKGSPSNPIPLPDLDVNGPAVNVPAVGPDAPPRGSPRNPIPLPDIDVNGAPVNVPAVGPVITSVPEIQVPDIEARPGNLNELSMDFVRGQGRAVEMPPLEITARPRGPVGRRRDVEEPLQLEEVVVGRRRPSEGPDDRRRRNPQRTLVPNEWRGRAVLTASWRGVAFQLETSTIPIGRKTYVHEYAQSSGIFVEDNGRETHYYRLQAFVIGDDFDLQRDELIRALEEEGPGDLVHPFYGVRRCRTVNPCTVTDNVREQRMAKFELTFVDVDEGVFPRQVTDFPMATQQIGLKLTEQSLNAAKSTESLLRAARVVPYLSTFLTYQGDLEQYLLGALRLALVGTSLQDEFATLLLTIQDVQLLLQCLRQWPSTPTCTSPEEQAAADALSTWARTEVENRAAVLVSITDYPSYDSALLEASAVMAQIIVDEREVFDSAIYNYLVDLRISMMRAVYSLSEILPRERQLFIEGPIPAIVLGWNLYEDPLRGREIVARNNVIHPNFVSGPVKVLSR